MLRLLRTCIALILAVFLVAVTPGIPAHAQATHDFAAIDSIMARLMDMYNIPGAALALVQDDQVIYSKGYGFRSVEDKQPVTPDTVFAIGSVTKSFTALDVAQLADQGKFSLDAPVITYLPDFKLSDPAATKALTVREVISHTSGLPRADELWAYQPPASRAQVISDMAKIPVTAKPGTLWQYCNQNFVLAGYLVEKVSGQTWEQYTQQHVFDPLGMKSANFTIEDLQKATHYALPYLPDVLKDYAAVPFTNSQYQGVKPMGPAGSINANVLDMAQYARFQLGDGTLDGQRLVSQKLLDAMHTRQIDVKGATEGNLLASISLTSNIGYGYGWFTEEYRGYKLVQHDGIIAGYTSEVMLIPSEKIGIVFLFNTNSPLFTDAARLSIMENLLVLKPEQDIAQAINTRYHVDPAEYKKDVAVAKAYKADSAALMKVTGDYSGLAGDASLVVRDGALHLLIATGKQDVVLIPLAPDTYLINGTLGSVIMIKPDASGVMTAYQDGTVVAQRLDKSAKATTYVDSQGRFTLTIPAGLTSQRKGDLLIVQPTVNPAGTMLVLASDSGADDLLTTVGTLVKRLLPKFDGKPVNQRDIPINTLKWTQFIYILPDGELFVVEATRQGKTDYFITLQGTQAVVQALTGNLNTMLLSFKITI